MFIENVSLVNMCQTWKDELIYPVRVIPKTQAEIPTEFFEHN